MELRGVITKFRYKSDSNAFKIAEFRPEDPKYGDIAILSGPIDHSNIDVSVTITGEWQDNPKYGRQFVVQQCMRNIPTDKGSTVKWLRDRKLVGPKSGEAIGEMFGDNLTKIIEEDWKQLTKIKKLTVAKADLIHKVWMEDALLRQVQIFLIQGGLPSTDIFAKRIINKFKENSLAKIYDNPYRLTEVSGIGFKSADAMARQLGWSTQRPERIEAATAFLLQEASNEGHTYLHKGELVATIQSLASIEVDGKTQLLPEADALTAIESVTKRGDIIQEKVTINTQENYLCYLPYYYDLEVSAAKRIAALLSLPQVLPNNIDNILSNVEKKLDLVLSVEQRTAVIEAIAHNCSVITGLPGTGKTSTCKALIQTAKAMGLRVMVAAPTGRAAKRLQEVTGHEAKTIHRTLQYIPEFNEFMYNEKTPLPCDLLIVDESSMLNLELMVDVLKAVPDSCSVVWIGDINQLPAIGAGTVLRDLIASKRVFTTVLDKIFRQAEGSLIIQNAHRIFHGESPQFPAKGSEADSYLIPVPKGISEITGKETDDISFVKKMLPSIYERIEAKLKFDPIKDVQVLMPMKIGPAGALAFNQIIQGIVNPNGERYEISGQIFRINDRVMQTVNDYKLDIYNGDVGFIRGVDVEAKTLDVEFFDSDVIYPFESINNLTLSYACSVHKSQGSEFPVTILILLGHHWNMLDRNIIYTANTRARKLAIYLSSKSAIETAVRTQKVEKRNSLLALRIRMAMKGKK